jgi:hypothetical protein
MRVLAALALAAGCTSSTPSGEGQPLCPVIDSPGEQTACESCEQIVQGLDSPPGTIMPAEQAITISVAWEDACSCLEGWRSPCNQHDFTIAAQCAGVACSVSPPPPSASGEATFDVVAHATGALTIPVQVTDLSSGVEAESVIGPIEIRTVTGIAFDCLVDGYAPCAGTVPQGHDLVVTAEARSAEGTFPFSLGAVTVSDREGPASATHAYDCEQNACAWSGVAPGTITVDASWNGVSVEQTYTVR